MYPILLVLFKKTSIIYFDNYKKQNYTKPDPVARQAKALVCGHSLVGIAGSNPSGEMDAVSCDYCVLPG